MLLGEVPAAFHAGVEDILLIAFGLALAEFLGPGRADRRRCGGSRPPGGAGRRCRSVAHGGVVHHQVPGVVGRRWAGLGAGSAGDAAVGAVIKDAKEQLRALPDDLAYGVLRYLNPEVDLDGPDPPIGFNYLGRLGGPAAELSDEMWRLRPSRVVVYRSRPRRCPSR